jgi:hypothetical protein
MKLRRYVLVRTLMSVVTGILVWAFISLCGLPLALEWGVIAFALNYIPFIGPLVASVLPALFALPQFAVWQNAILVFGCPLYSVPRRQLFETSDRRQHAVDVTVYGVVRCFLLDLLVGDHRRVHRRAYRHRDTDDLRATWVEPLGGEAFWSVRG